METIDETLTHILVNHGVVRDVVGPRVEFVCSREFTLQQEVGNFKEVALFCKLFNGVSAVTQNACVAIEVGDRR